MPTTLLKRPLSPLDSEPLIPLPKDILCPGSDDEATAEEHKDKRRRIEAQGQQYLRGRPLFILSAGLRGRLNDWVNPWGRKRRGNGDHERRTKSATPVELTDAPLWMGNAQSILDRQSEDYNTVTASKQDPHALSLNPGDFQNWSKSDLAQAIKTSHNFPRKWLKSDNVSFRERARRRSRSPTPTPDTRPRDQALALLSTSARPPAKIPPSLQAARTVSGESLSKPAYDFSFTPINKGTFPENTKIEVAHGRLDPAKPPEAQVDNEQLLYPSKVTVGEMILDSAREPIRQGHFGVKKEAGKQSGTRHGHIQAGNLSERSASLALEASLKDLSYEISHGFSDSTGQDALVTAAPTNGLSAFENTLQALPPSTNLQEFNYRYARKHNPMPPKERPSFGETLEIAKAKAQAEMLEIANARAKAKSQEQEIRRLSFTASGNVKKSKSISRKRLEHCTGSPQQRQRQRKSSLEQKETIQTTLPAVEDESMATVTSPQFMMSGALSCETDDQPEAQIVPRLPVVFGLGASGSSTDMLETEKQSLKPQNIEEGDSYADLSTQAAILKARRSFQNANFPPVKMSSPRQDNEATTSAASLSTHKGTKAAKEIEITHEPFREPSPTVFKPSALDSHGDEPMSTQAMIDAMSPFALTTIKKKKRGTSLGPPLSPTSPTANPFSAHSSSASVTSAHVPSPSSPMSGTNSKPPSFGLTSYSVVPNSMVTDMDQQDGQQPQFRYFDSSEWDLDAAIEDAGKFLGSWDVEQEARKEGLRGSVGGAKKDNGEDGREESVMVERMRETGAGLVKG